MAKTRILQALRIDLRSIASRLVIGAALWCIVALVAGAILLAVLFRATLDQGLEARLRATMDNLVAAIALEPQPPEALEAAIGRRMGGDFERAFSGAYWQVRPWPTDAGDASDRTAASRSLWSADLPAPATGRPFQEAFLDSSGPLGQRLRTYARIVKIPGEERSLLLAVAFDTRPLRQEAAAFQGGLAAAVAFLAAMLIAGILVQVRIGLQPLRALARALAQVRDGRIERLEGSYPSELEPLTAELNRLIAHNAEVLERARTQVGNLAHALKTPLAVLANEARREQGAQSQTVLGQTQAMEAHVQRYLALARAAARRQGAGARTELGPVLDAIIRTLMIIHVARGIAPSVSLKDAPVFAGEREDLEEMLGNLLDNAFKWAESRIDVGACRQEARLVVTVADDGPGVPEDLAEQMMQRGARLDESIPGSGLGLSIVRQIAEAYAGTLTLRQGELGGLIAELTLPAAPDPRGPG